MQPDFIPVRELATRTGFAVGSLYNQHQSGRGPLGPILRRLGGRVGAMRADYEAWLGQQRKLKDIA